MLRALRAPAPQEQRTGARHAEPHVHRAVKPRDRTGGAEVGWETPGSRGVVWDGVGVLELGFCFRIKMNYNTLDARPP